MMNTNKLFFHSAGYVIWGTVFTWGVVFANNVIYPVISAQYSDVPSYINDILSDGVLLFVAFIPMVWAPKFFGYQVGAIHRHWKLLLSMTVFFVAAPLVYRLILGQTPFGANTWFFEGVVVPLAEEGFFRGILLSMLLFGFAKLYKEATAEWLTLIFSTLIFANAHLNNLGHYPTGFILFQVGFSMLVGFAFGYTVYQDKEHLPCHFASFLV